MLSQCANLYTVAFFFLLVQYSVMSPLTLPIMAVAGAIMLATGVYAIVGFRRMAVGKGQPGGWMWMGLLGTIGLIVVFLLPDRSDAIRGFSVEPLKQKTK